MDENVLGGDPLEPETSKRGPGRPKGSKNKTRATIDGRSVEAEVLSALDERERPKAKSKVKGKKTFDWSKAAGFSQSDPKILNQLADLPFLLHHLTCLSVKAIPYVPGAPPEDAQTLAREAMRQWIGDITIEAHPATVYLTAVLAAVVFSPRIPKDQLGIPWKGTPKNGAPKNAPQQPATPTGVSTGGPDIGVATSDPESQGGRKASPQ